LTLFLLILFNIYKFQNVWSQRSFSFDPPIASSLLELSSVAPSLASLMAFSIYSSFSLLGKKKAETKAIKLAISSITIGHGRSTSAAREDATVADLATRLQIPIAVAFL
jgi:hypothetical protein